MTPVENSKAIDDVLLDITPMGLLLLRRVMFCVSYLAEGFSIAELPTGLRECLARRDFSSRSFIRNRVWSLKCTANAEIAFDIIKGVEEIEEASYSRFGSFEEFRISGKLKVSLTDEIRRIYIAESRTGSPHFSDVEEVFKRCRAVHPSFSPLVGKGFLDGKFG
jgi:hypothetical protein